MAFRMFLATTYNSKSNPVNRVTRLSYVFTHDYKGYRSCLESARSNPRKQKLQDALV